MVINKEKYYFDAYFNFVSKFLTSILSPKTKSTKVHYNYMSYRIRTLKSYDVCLEVLNAMLRAAYARVMRYSLLLYL